MTLDAFLASLAAGAPPEGLSLPLVSLWWAKKGDWKRAHDLINDEPGIDEAWVHAHLHRVEGDLWNAAYWYRRADKPQATGGLDAEWTEIATALLAMR